MDFVEATGKEVLITDEDSLKQALEGQAGTFLVPDGEVEYATVGRRSSAAAADSAAGYPKRMASTSLWMYRILLLAGCCPSRLPVIKIRQWLTGKSRPRFRDRFARSLPKLPEDGVWIQAVSVGEVEMARRLVAELERRAPELPLFLTATTATGLDLARRTLGDRLPVFPCPIDLPGPVSRVFEAARPRLVVLVETELWPEMLHQAGLREVPVAVVNARLSPGSFAGYRRVAGRLRIAVRTAGDGARPHGGRRRTVCRPRCAEGANRRLGQHQIRSRGRPASAGMGGRCPPGRGQSSDRGCRVHHGGRRSTGPRCPLWARCRMVRRRS